MKFSIPQPLKSEHEALHERLRQATEAGGEVGEAAKTVARLMHPHFLKEETIQFLGVCSATSSFAYAARGTRSAVVPLRGNHRSNV